MVLPAALLLARKSKDKPLNLLVEEIDKATKVAEIVWCDNTQGQKVLNSFPELLKVWQQDDMNSHFDIRDDEANCAHRDWDYILQAQDAKALLQLSCDRFAYALYNPIYQNQSLVE